MFSDMKPAEKKLLEACQKGEVLNLGNKRPTEKTAENEIRAEFLKALILSNNREIEVNTNKIIIRIVKIQFFALYITGELDLSHYKIDLSLLFINSIFENDVKFINSTINTLYLSGNELKSIYAFSLICTNGIYITESNIIGEVNFSYTEIQSILFDRVKIGTLDNRYSLNCQGARIKQHLTFLDTTIYGNLILSFVKINFLNLSSLHIYGDFFLISSKIDTILENIEDRIKGVNDIYLDGLEYNHLTGQEPNSTILIKWLNKTQTFYPQPYKQLAKVLRNMGHHNEADDIMIEYNKEVMKKDFKIYNLFVFILKWIYGFTAGYGYKPIRVFITMFCIWLSCGWLYQKTADIGVFAPSNPLIFQNTIYDSNVNKCGMPKLSWQGLYIAYKDEQNISYCKYKKIEKDENQASIKNDNWTTNENLNGEYTTFSPYWYSLDILFPIVDLQMDKDWGIFISPINSDITLNDVTRWIVWIEILLGWIYSLILVAILSGLAKNEKD
jgi:hypothetical protein